MSLEEAIAHCEEVALNCSRQQCALEHLQLAKWLKELQCYKRKYEKEEEIYQRRRYLSILG